MEAAAFVEALAALARGPEVHRPFLAEQIARWDLAPRSTPLTLPTDLPDPVLDLVRGWDTDGLRILNFSFRDSHLTLAWPDLLRFAIIGSVDLYVEIPTRRIHGFHAKELHPKAFSHDSATFLDALAVYAGYLAALTVDVQADAGRSAAVKATYGRWLRGVVRDPFWDDLLP